MKRSRAFILSEQLMTIMLQASFIIVLCASFYQLISFYTRTQQVLTARNHAERVISFMDEKIRNAGLGLWRCGSSSAIREKFGGNMGMLMTTQTKPYKGYKLPVALQQGFPYDNKTPQQNTEYTQCMPQLSLAQNSGNVLTVMYAERGLSTGDYEIISAFKEAKLLSRSVSGLGTARDYVDGTVKLLDTDSASKLREDPLFDLKNTSSPEKNIKRYAVMEGLGLPLLLYSSPITGDTAKGNITVYVYSAISEGNITVPAGGELLALNCMQMFVQTYGGERQFAYRELTDSGNAWDTTYNQEKGILDIHMEVDRGKNIFTLWVLASGGYDASMNNPRPASWPEEAQPTAAQWGKKKDKEYDYTDYPHHIVYVSRAQWKLNNIPQGFTWN